MLALAVLLAVLFFAAQRERSDVTFGGGPVGTVPVESTSGASIPSQSQIHALLAADRVVRIDGAVAVYDEAAVLPLLAEYDLRLLLLPPGLSSDQVADLDLPIDVVSVRGLETALSPFVSAPSDENELINAYAGRDVTDSIVSLIAAVKEGPELDPVDRVGWRDPTPDELAAVLEQVGSDGGIAFTDPAARFDLPPAAADAFPHTAPVVVVTPYAEPGVPAVDFRAALEDALPDRPIIQLTGQWLSFAGAATSAEAVTASFYGEYGSRLARADHSQQVVLGAMLDRIAEFRHSGVFDRPAPQPAPDPVRLSLPWLPWVFAAVALAYVGLLIRDRLRPPAPTGTRDTADEAAALAGLSELVVELSRLAIARGSPHLDRAGTLLGVAGDALDVDDHQRVGQHLDEARTELDRLTADLGLDHLRPDAFLAGRWQ